VDRDDWNFPKLPKWLKSNIRVLIVLGLLIVIGASVLWHNYQSNKAENVSDNFSNTTNSDTSNSGSNTPSSGQNSSSTSDKSSSNTSSKSSSKSLCSQTTTDSIATLNAQAVALFNPVISNLEQQMSQGEADAAQSNAGDVSSAFHSWETAEQDKQNVTNNNYVTQAYNNADNAYYCANQTAPDALANLDNDAGNLPGDITTWANDEEMVEGDEVMGSSSLSTDQQTANTDMQQYQTDLAKAQTDISQL